MATGRIDEAIARIEAALTRIETARPVSGQSHADEPARLLALVNRHEKLREEVADSLRDLDALIAELEQ